jgi:hypothetical protein
VLTANDLIYPVFVLDGPTRSEGRGVDARSQRVSD